GEGAVDVEHLVGDRFDRQDAAVERRGTASAAALLRVALAGVIDEDLAHRTRREGEKMGAVLPSGGRAHQLDERLVDERRRRQRVARPERSELRAREASQL